MAQGMGDYRWERFIGGIEPTIFSSGMFSTNSLPSPEAAAYIVGEAKKRQDWATIIKFAEVARQPLMRAVSENIKTEWRPVDGGMQSRGMAPQFEEHPIKTVYAPHLEALLRLGDIDGANKVYDEMIRIEGKANAAAAADVANSLGMEDLAKLWGLGEQVTPVPSVSMTFGNKTAPVMLFFGGYEGALPPTLIDIDNKLFLKLNFMSSGLFGGAPAWKKDEVGWALVSGDKRILYQDSSIPDLESVRTLLRRLGIKGIDELYRKYIEEHGSTPGIEMLLALKLIRSVNYDIENANPPDNDRNEALASEAIRLLNNVLRNNPDVLVNLPDGAGLYEFRALMGSLPRALVSNIESSLEKKPSSENLWSQWLSWNRAGELDLSLESLVERVKPSPLSDGGILGLPWSVIDEYYRECKKNGSWSKVIALLKTTWDREYPRIVSPEKSFSLVRNSLGDDIGMHLIEAYLQDGKPRDADEIFKAVLDCGEKFKDISKIVELAKAKGHERLATEWQAAVARAAQPETSAATPLS